MYEVKFEEKKQWIERPASEMGKLGERSRKAGNGKIEVLKKVRVKTRGKKVVLVGFKKPLATGPHKPKPPAKNYIYYIIYIRMRENQKFTKK